jgi:hypothetical protein
VKTIIELKTMLVGLGYTIKAISGKNVDIIAEGDRPGVLRSIADSLGGKYNPKGGTYSVGRTEFTSGFTVNAKPKGGGSGAGSDITTLAESAQCVYCAALWYGEDYSATTFKSVSADYDIDGKLIDIINKLPPQWIDSCILTAVKLKSLLGNKKYKFHRGSKWVNELQDHWKELNKQEKTFSNLNKWSPADIYMISQAGERIDFKKAKTIVELNAMMLKAIDSKDVIGVSLKQVKNTVTASYKNISSDRYSYEFVSSTAGKRGFLLSGDAYVNFSGGGEIQFRTFGSTWQGEIKGKNANMGKISGGPINAIMLRNGIRLKQQSEVLDHTPALLKEFYKYYKYFEKNETLYEDEFIAFVKGKEQNWWLSKFLSTQFIYELDHYKDKTKIITSLVGYAASESELSGPYLKVS